jgi:hypothetical protein
VGGALAGWTARAADPTTAQCLAASESSLGLRNQHKLREARAQLLICSDASCPADVRNECIRQVAAVNAAMSMIAFDVKDAAGNDLLAVRVTVDGRPIADRLEGTAFPLDPGPHAFTFEVPGQAPIRKQFVLVEGQKDRRERITFGAPAGAPAAESPAAVVVQPASEPHAAEGASNPFGTRRIWAIVAAGVGVAGLGVGIAYGLQAFSKHDDATNSCPNNPCMSQDGFNLWRQAVSAGNVSTVAFIVGAAGVATGAALWFTGKPRTGDTSENPGTRVGLGLGTVQLKATW